MVLQRSVSVAEFLALPESKPGLEFIKGRVVQKPVTNADHIRIVWRIAGAFLDYARAHGGSGGPEGSVAFPLGGSDADVLLPDFAFWRAGEEMGDYPLSPPTLAVEVRSPSQTMKSQREKCEFYVANGVSEAWLVDPDSESVEVFLPSGATRRLSGDAVIEAAALPGLALALDAIFR